MSGSGLFTKQAPKLQHLLTHGIAAEVADLRSDLAAELAPLAAITVEEWSAPAAASNTAFMTSTATSTSAQTYTGAALNGATGTAKLTPPRNVTVTATDNSGNAGYTGSVTFKGKDIDGNAITETVAISNNATAAGNKAFASVSEIDVPAQPDALGHLSFGFGSKIGLAKTIKSRAGGPIINAENVDGSRVTTGAVVAATTGAPHGTYAPASAPNGTHNYAIYYEFDPTV